MPYAVIVAVCCAIGYVVAGVTNGLGQVVSTGISLVVAIVILTIILLIAPKVWKYTPEQQEIINSVEDEISIY